MQAAVDRVKAAVKGSDMNEIKSSSDALSAIWQELAPKLYQQGAPQGEPQPQQEQQPDSSQSSGGGKVEDAEFEVVDDKNKK